MQSIRNKDLKEHIAKGTGDAGAHDRESKSNKRTKVRYKMRAYKQAYNTNNKFVEIE